MWFDTPQGRRAARSLSLELDKITDYISGKYLLQLGSTGDTDLLAKLHFRNKIIVSPSIEEKGINCHAKINNLPFAMSSVDCVVAPFTMEIFAKHLSMLSEIDSVLAPEGFVILFGINPISFWGLAAFLRCLRPLNKYSLKLRSAISIKNSLLALGYRQCYLSSFYFIPPFNSSKLINNLEFLNEMGKMVWPYPASFYCLIAKEVHT